MLQVSAGLRFAIEDRYEKTMGAYPRKKPQVDRFIKELPQEQQLCMRALYGSMHPNDVLSFPPRLLHTYVTASLEALETVDYAASVPAPLFFSYVLSHRVNAEWPDGSRPRLLRELRPLVRGKTMEEAALAVNLWCFRQAAYAPTDGRTLGPLAVIRRGVGRCGEESVLAVSALRSVGIPARQVYVPRWSHCDDNHAWVEVWTDGQWHYLGACEPEPRLDRGWFTAAASRAMLVHSKVWSCCADPDEVACRGPVYDLINVTDRYAKTAVLTVTVEKNGAPVPGVPVEFQINNYSELFPIHTQKTDDRGQVRFRTGLGGLCVSAEQDGRICFCPVDLRRQQAVTLELRDALAPEQLPDRDFDLAPPDEAAPTPLSPVPEAFKAKLREAEARRLGQKREVPSFAAEFRPVLDTLREKDLADLDEAVLSDALEAALPVRDRYNGETWQQYVLAPRILDEMLLPERKALREILPAFGSPREILKWMQENLTPLPDYGVRNFCPSPLGCIENRQLPEGSFGLVFTALCRAFGFAARCNPITARGQWLEGTCWLDAEPLPPAAELTIESAVPAAYEERFTLGRWNGHGFETLQLPGFTAEGQKTVSVPPGQYRLVTTTRQIDGTASTCLRHFSLGGAGRIALTLPPDRTAEKLRAVKVRDRLPEGPVKERLAADSPVLLLYVRPGAEPTEHLLRELLESRAEFSAARCQLVAVLRREQERQDPTLRQVEKAFPNLEVLVQPERDTPELLHQLLGVGDRRLPFVLLQNRQQQVVCAFANYQIRMARTLLGILKLIE